jgi:nucleotide-binding universal stress UspA family protein
MEDQTMYKNILIPTDGSTLAAKAVDHGIALAKAVGAQVTAVMTTEPYRVLATDPEMITDTVQAYERHAAAAAAKALEVVAKAAKAAGVACETIHLEQGFPYEGIIKTAAAHNCDLIVMASHGRRGIAAVVLGSETIKVLTNSAIPVLVCR